MKDHLLSLRSVAAGILIFALGGCASQASRQQQDHQAHHPDNAGTQGTVKGSPGKPGSAMAMGGGDAAMMCDMYDRMMGARTPAERRALMEEHMKSMTPEMRERHMQMMREHMQMMQEMTGAQPSGK